MVTASQLEGLPGYTPRRTPFWGGKRREVVPLPWLPAPGPAPAAPAGRVSPGAGRPALPCPALPCPAQQPPALLPGTCAHLDPDQALLPGVDPRQVDVLQRLPTQPEVDPVRGHCELEGHGLVRLRHAGARPAPARGKRGRGQAPAHPPCPCPRLQTLPAPAVPGAAPRAHPARVPAPPRPPCPSPRAHPPATPGPPNGCGAPTLARRVLGRSATMVRGSRPEGCPAGRRVRGRAGAPRPRGHRLDPLASGAGGGPLTHASAHSCGSACGPVALAVSPRPSGGHCPALPFPSREPDPGSQIWGEQAEKGRAQSPLPFGRPGGAGCPRRGLLKGLGIHQRAQRPAPQGRRPLG